MDWTPRVGEVVPYAFLWAHESALGEDAGRKLRPCVIVVAIHKVTDGWRIAVAPITTRHPKGREALELPQGVKRHLQLDTRKSWIVCDELNQFEWPGFDLGSTPSGAPSYGFIPKALGRAVREAILKAQAAGELKVTGRDG